MVNEALSSGCNMIVTKLDNFRMNMSKMMDAALFIEPQAIVTNKQCFGQLCEPSIPGIIKCLKSYVLRDFNSRKTVSRLARATYDSNNETFVKNIASMVNSLLSVELYDLKSMFPKEDELPDVSIVTLTRDRRVFMPLAKYSYMIQSYPEDKLEWVIVDDGDDPIEDTLFGVPNVRYIRCDTKLTISQKRNLGVRESLYDIVAFMDDDDVYPNNSIIHRTAMMLKEPKKECAFCTTIPCYDITSYSSFMNVPPMTLEQSKRVSEATLIFTKKFWEERGFQDDVQIGEADAFIHGREHMCRELSPQDVIVSLVHPKNTSARRTPTMKEPNGNHYGFNEKLFEMVSQIGEELKEKATPSA
jgi:hypothetical protein